MIEETRLSIAYILYSKIKSPLRSLKFDYKKFPSTLSYNSISILGNEHERKSFGANERNEGSRGRVFTDKPGGAPGWRPVSPMTSPGLLKTDMFFLFTRLLLGRLN